MIDFGIPRLRRSLHRWVERARTVERTYLLVLAAGIGVLGGAGAVGFRFLIRLMQRGAWGSWTYTLDVVRDHPWWWVLLLPAVGGALVGPLIHFFAKEAKGHGVPEVMEAVALRSGAIRPRLVFVKALASALTIGSGGSVGREGPIVQIGSALGSTVGRWFGLAPAQLRTVVACGAAAGIAATFNAPVAGALFAVEVILGDFGVSEFSPIVMSSVLATVVSRHFLGDFPALQVPPHEMVSAWELLVYGVLGLAAAGVALGFIELLYRLEDRLEALPLRPWQLPAVGGLLVGALALAFPEVMGVGYEATTEALNGALSPARLAVLIPAKLVATSLTLGSGASGGIFAPSLFLGAMTGGLVGGLAHTWFPAVTAGAGAYALVGMGAVVAGTTQAPLTAILIIFELTSDYRLILPLMASCIIATVVTSRGGRPSIYTRKLLRRGVEVVRGQELNILKSLRVEDVMDRQVAPVRETEHLGRLVEKLPENPYGSFYVVHDDGRLAGVIPLSELRDALFHAHLLSDILVAGELAHAEGRTVAPTERLDVVMKLFAAQRPDDLPVVRPEDGVLVGVVTRRHLVEAYDRGLVRREMTTSLGGHLAATSSREVLLGDGFRMVDVDLPHGFAGRTIGELQVRGRYGVQILLVRRGQPGASQDLVPNPETRLALHDQLVVLGRSEDIGRLGEA